MFQRIERAAKISSFFINATMLGVEVYKYFRNNGSQSGRHAEAPGAE